MRICEDCNHARVARDASAVLGWARTRAAGTDENVPRSISDAIHDDVVFPVIAEVISVEQARTWGGNGAERRGILVDAEDLVLNVSHTKADATCDEVV
jgi:hypothetical protein